MFPVIVFAFRLACSLCACASFCTSHWAGLKYLAQHIIAMATTSSSSGVSLASRQLSLPDRTLPPSVPLIISSQDHWDTANCQLVTPKTPDPNDHSLKLVEDGLALLRSIDKPLAVLSICGPYRSGKSYFLSRVLGSPGAFKLGHSMQACTRGIWMATTALECEEFAVVLLDTEGIDAVRASETMSMSLLTLTTLLSSFLIYNSKKVPQKVDLNKMRCFSQLSTSLLSQCGKSMSSEVKKAFFPRFLWILRDVTLKMTDKEGREIEPTEFLHTRVLSDESGKLTDLGKSLVSLFPSLECAKLPLPSTKKEVIRGIVEHPEKLRPAFTAAVAALIEKLLQEITPKRAVDGKTVVNGKALAALASVYVDAVNCPGAVPDLDQGWQAVVRLEVKKFSDTLVEAYEGEMQVSLKGNLPMEERNLLRLHQQTLNAIKSKLREEISVVNPLHSSDDEVQPFLDELEQDIVQWSELDSDGEKKVTGGSLYRFTTENFAASKEFCEVLFGSIVENCQIMNKIQAAVRNSQPLSIQSDLQRVSTEYKKAAVGPAAGQVHENLFSELTRISEIVQRIPGSPQDVQVVGRARDRVKLTWKPPLHNPESVEEYVVYKRTEEGEWEEAVRTPKTSVVVKGLTLRRNEFNVRATNSEIESLVELIEAEVELPMAYNAKRFCGLSCFVLPFAIECALRDEEKIKHSIKHDDYGLLWRMGLCLALLPVSFLLAPVSGPVGAAVGAYIGSKEEFGDLKEDD